MTHDPVNHPKHYTQHPSGVECIEVTRHMNFNLGNVVKYVWRSGLKDEAPTIQDLEKAAWYLNDEIERRKKEVSDGAGTTAPPGRSDRKALEREDTPRWYREWEK